MVSAMGPLRERRSPFGWATAGLALSLIVLSVGFGFSAAPSAAAVSASGGPDAHAVYLSDCAVCHGSDGRGSDRGPTLVNVGRAATDYELTTGRMPLAAAGHADEPGTPVRPLPNKTLADSNATVARHDPAYPSETIAALVDYVAQLTGGGGPDIPSPAPGDVARGGESFRLQCAACHEWAGTGGALLQREAPSLHASTPVQIAEAIRVGPGQMPAFGQAALTDAEVNDVVAYVRYLNAPRDRGGANLGHVGPVAEGAVALVAMFGVALLLRWVGERG